LIGLVTLKIDIIIQKEDPNINLSTKVILTGVSIYWEIIQYAEKENIDLTVIGTRRKSGVKKI
jgi:nucleotide-binding universal stress UspA family protein